MRMLLRIEGSSETLLVYTCDGQSRKYLQTMSYPGISTPGDIGRGRGGGGAPSVCSTERGR